MIKRSYFYKVEVSYGPAYRRVTQPIYNIYSYFSWFANPKKVYENIERFTHESLSKEKEKYHIIITKLYRV